MTHPVLVFHVINEKDLHPVGLLPPVRLIDYYRALFCVQWYQVNKTEKCWISVESGCHFRILNDKNKSTAEKEKPVFEQFKKPLKFCFKFSVGANLCKPGNETLSLGKKSN